MYSLVLVRHGESAWNLENRFTGWTDVDLSPKGIEEAKAAGQLMKKEGYDFRRKDPRYRSLKLMITKDREHLYSDIDRRVDLMVESGLLDEVKTIIDKYGTSSTAFQAIGYKELIPYLSGTEPLSKCIDDIKRASRNLAKRQLTWFRRDDEIITLNRDSFPSEEEFIKNTEERIKAFLDV